MKISLKNLLLMFFIVALILSWLPTLIEKFRRPKFLAIEVSIPSADQYIGNKFFLNRDSTHWLRLQADFLGTTGQRNSFVWNAKIRSNSDTSLFCLYDDSFFDDYRHSNLKCIATVETEDLGSTTSRLAFTIKLLDSKDRTLAIRTHSIEISKKTEREQN